MQCFVHQFITSAGILENEYLSRKILLKSTLYSPYEIENNLKVCVQISENDILESYKVSEPRPDGRPELLARTSE